MDQTTTSGLDEAIAAAGGSQAALADRLGVTQQAVSTWVKQGYVPVRRALEIEALLGVHRHRLLNPRLADLVDLHVAA